MSEYPLKDMKLWWPAWQMGIPFHAFGFSGPSNRLKWMGDDYEFYYDPEIDVLLCPDGKHMPISEIIIKDVDEGPIPLFTSCSTTARGHVQINCKVKGESGYSINMYPLECLYVVGDAYDPNE